MFFRNYIYRIMFILIISLRLYADVTGDIQNLVEDFSVEYKNENPDLVFRPNIGILPFSNLSPEAEKYRVGESVSILVENAFSRSLLFNLIDDKIRDKLLEEIKFSLSGLADTDRIEPGKIEGIDYFVDGSVSLLGDSFTISMRVIEVNSSKVIYISEISIPKYDIVDYSEKLAAAYVSSYGLGIELYLTPFYYLNSEMSDIEGQIEEGWPIGFTINYRINRNLVVWMGFEGTTGAFRLDRTFKNKEYQVADMVNIDPLYPGLTIGYYKERTYTSGKFGLGYVFNFSRKFNGTIGGDIKVGMSFLQQFYYMEDRDSSEIINRVIRSQDMSFIILSPVLKLQYYVTPRITVNLGYSYGFQLQQKDETSYTYADDNVSDTDGFFPELYNLKPGVDPEGNAHVMDFSGHRVVMGIGVYF